MMEGTFEGYGDYNKSNVEWVEELPTAWGTKRLKEILRDVVYGTSEKTEEVGNYEVLGMGDIYEGKITFPKKRFIDNVPKDLLLKKEDLLFNRTNSIALVGKVGWIDEILEDVTFASYLIRLRVMKNQCSRYFWYLLNSEYFICYSRSNAIQTANQANLSSSKLKQFRIPAIDYKLQKAISAYLDTKTAQIDRKIDLLTQKATKYGKLKQSLISETVTRGLDKTMAMKDSGVEWIGEVPEHWGIERIGTAFEERREKVNDTDYPPLSVTMKGIVPQLDTAAKTNHNDNRKRVSINDFVINSRSDRRGSSGVSELNGSVSVINIVLAPRKHFYGKYLHHLFRSYRFIEEFYRVGRGIVDDLWTTKYTVMKAIDFAFPDFEEQKAIANHLDTKTAHIDRIVETINVQIEKLKELRKTLINDVVTGKIKVA